MKLRYAKVVHLIDQKLLLDSSTKQTCREMMLDKLQGKG
jgi:hypothetical protein